VASGKHAERQHPLGSSRPGPDGQRQHVASLAGSRSPQGLGFAAPGTDYGTEPRGVASSRSRPHPQGRIRTSRRGPTSCVMGFAASRSLLCPTVTRVLGLGKDDGHGGSLGRESGEARASSKATAAMKVISDAIVDRRRSTFDVIWTLHRPTKKLSGPARRDEPHYSEGRRDGSVSSLPHSVEVGLYVEFRRKSGRASQIPRSLALQPACSPSSLSDPLPRRLRRLCRFRRRSVSYLLERPVAGR
jgi:hypothetical protein